jgi:hypothetical protein
MHVLYYIPFKIQYQDETASPLFIGSFFPKGWAFIPLTGIVKLRILSKQAVSGQARGEK